MFERLVVVPRRYLDEFAESERVREWYLAGIGGGNLVAVGCTCCALSPPTSFRTPRSLHPIDIPRNIEGDVHSEPDPYFYGLGEGHTWRDRRCTPLRDPLPGGSSFAERLGERGYCTSTPARPSTWGWGVEEVEGRRVVVGDGDDQRSQVWGRGAAHPGFEEEAGETVDDSGRGGEGQDEGERGDGLDGYE